MNPFSFDIVIRACVPAPASSRDMHGVIDRERKDPAR